MGFAAGSAEQEIIRLDHSPLHFAAGKDTHREFSDRAFLGYIGQELLLGARGAGRVVKEKAAEHLWQRALVATLGYEAHVTERDDHPGADVYFTTPERPDQRRGHQIKTTERADARRCTISHVCSCQDNPLATIADYRRAFLGVLEHQDDYELIPILRYHLRDQFYPADARESGPALRCDLIDLPLEQFASLEELEQTNSRRTAHTILLGNPKSQMSLQVFSDPEKSASSHLFTLCATRAKSRIVLNTIQNRACRELAHFWLPPIEAESPKQPFTYPSASDLRSRVPGDLSLEKIS